MNYKISQRAASLSPSLTLAIDAKAKAMKAAGEDVVGFGAGEPDFDTPQHIKDAAAKALAAGFTKYTPSSGIPGIARGHRRQVQARKRPDLQAVANHRLLRRQTFLLQHHPRHLRGGRRSHHPRAVLVELPGNGEARGRQAGDSADHATRRNSRSRRQQLRAAITPNTRLFVLNSPSNPTGSVYTPEEIKALGDICVEKNVLIMSDEIYEHLLYDGAKVKSVASFSPAHQEHTIIVHGLAKAYSHDRLAAGFSGRAGADCQGH